MPYSTASVQDKDNETSEDNDTEISSSENDGDENQSYLCQLLGKQTTLLEKQTNMLDHLVMAKNPSCDKSPTNDNQSDLCQLLEKQTTILEHLVMALNSSEPSCDGSPSNTDGKNTDFEFTATKIVEPIHVCGHDKLINSIETSIKMQCQQNYYPNFEKFLNHAWLLYGCPG